MIKQFQNEPKRGGSQLISTFRMKLEAQICEKFEYYQESAAFLTRNHQSAEGNRTDHSSVSEWLPTVAGAIASFLVPLAFRLFR